MTPRFNLKSRDWIDQPDRKRQFNVELFREVASKYAFVTKALSLGRDQAWKRALIAELPEQTAPRCMDLACGTGDITFALAKKYPDGSVLGVDICDSMLALAVQHGDAAKVQFVVGDMCQTPVADQSIDVVTGGYALRNAPSLERTLDEIARVLRPGGTAAFLDFSKSNSKTVQRLQYALLTSWGGFWGFALHRNPEVYTYIAKSLRQFPDRESLHQMIRSRGFVDVRSRRFYFGALELLVFSLP